MRTKARGGGEGAAAAHPPAGDDVDANDAKAAAMDVDAATAEAKATPPNAAAGDGATGKDDGSGHAEDGEQRGAETKKSEGGTAAPGSCGEAKEDKIQSFLETRLGGGKKRKGAVGQEESSSATPSAKRAKKDGNATTASVTDANQLQQQQQLATLLAARQLMMTSQQRMTPQQMLYAQQMALNAQKMAQAQQMALLSWNPSSTMQQRAAGPTGRETHRLVLTLPTQKTTKLGLILENNAVMGLPELKALAPTSPMAGQIPLGLRSGHCIALLKSDAIGLVQPTNAAECVSFIVKAREGGKDNPIQIEMVLIETTGCPTQPAAPMAVGAMPPSKKTPSKRKAGGGRKSHEDELRHKSEVRAALLDYFCDPSLKTSYAYCQEKGKERLRMSIDREMKKDPRLAALEQKRHIPARRREAYGLIDRIVPDVSDELAAFAQAKRTALLEFFRDDAHRTIPTFCHEKKLSKQLKAALAKVIDENESLKQLVEQRDSAEQCNKARRIIEKLLPDTTLTETEEKLAFERKKKRMLLDFFGERLGSLESFCRANKIDADLRRSMMRFMDMDESGRLPKLVDKRRDEARREEAIDIIKKMTSLWPNSTPSDGDDQADDSAKEQEKEKDDDPSPKSAPAPSSGVLSKRDRFFSPQNMAIIAEILDFNVRPRMTRDGSKAIDVHDRKYPDENLMLLILDLTNRVLEGRSLSLRDRNTTMQNCAKIMFYDHGYKTVACTTSFLQSRWAQRLESAYMSGAEQHPLNRLWTGATSYVEKIDQDHPGLIARLYQHANEYLGQDATFAEKAMFMNEKSMEDACDDPSLPVLDMNPQRLRYYVLAQEKTQQPGNSGEGLAKSTQPKTEDLTIDQIEKKHPGLIGGLYDFALEAMGPSASYHIIATCMNERAKEVVEENPTTPLVVVSKKTLPTWLKKQGLSES